MNYAGIGPRETPAPIADMMFLIAMNLAQRGLTLRSGGAHQKPNSAPNTKSADLVFEAGCDAVGGAKVIRTPTIWQPALDHAARYHPAWDKLDLYKHKQYHARNSLIIMGDTLDDPVNFVVTYTPGGELVGGTAQGLRIAYAHSIPVFNLAHIAHQTALWDWINGGAR